MRLPSSPLEASRKVTVSGGRQARWKAQGTDGQGLGVQQEHDYPKGTGLELVV